MPDGDYGGESFDAIGLPKAEREALSEARGRERAARPIRLQYDAICFWIGIVGGPILGAAHAAWVMRRLRRGWLLRWTMVCFLTTFSIAALLCSLNLFYSDEVLAIRDKLSGETDPIDRFGIAFAWGILVWGLAFPVIGGVWVFASPFVVLTADPDRNPAA